MCELLAIITLLTKKNKTNKRNLPKPKAQLILDKQRIATQKKEKEEARNMTMETLQLQ